MVIQEVECIVTDGPLVVSSCLGGEIRVWDSTSGEHLTCINRKKLVAFLSPLKNSSLWWLFNHTYFCVSALSHWHPLYYVNQHRAGTWMTVMLICMLSTTALWPRSAALDLHQLLLPWAQVPCKMTPSPWHRSCDPPRMIVSATMAPSVTPPGGSQRSHSSSSATYEQHPAPRQRQFHHARHRSADISFTNIMPDLSETIDVNFGSLPQSTSSECLNASGYNFSRFDKYYDEHKKTMKEKQVYISRKRSIVIEREREDSESNGSSTLEQCEESRMGRTWSLGSSPGLDMEMDSPCEPQVSKKNYEKKAPPVWCLACHHNLVVCGCGNGRLEVIVLAK